MSVLRQVGFTLVEILVVLVIIGITVALISVNLVPDDKRVLTIEAQKLALLFEQARDEAIISGKEIAWSVEGDKTRFWRKDDKGKWMPNSGDDLFRDRDLAAGVKLAELQINSVKAAVNERLIFSPGGMNMPFKLDLALNSSRVSIAGDNLGKLALKNDE
ncbi:MAG: GspH/FimT family pseudopilin [Gammaproteobacteria bacterium]|nr:GspH/FimT family pseudopilin [Gammaproteobacteria bacterium]MBU1979392.1 GspH/FimT family pseudopilin [Gammaproteobacteria bacterium]